MRTIVSLTSYPARIEYVYKTIQSLIDQSVKPDLVILWLSEEEFDISNKELPKSLSKIQNEDVFVVRWIKGNLKSHKKYFYVLQEYGNEIVITVDDDKIYSKNMIRDLLLSYQENPRCVSARVVRNILVNENGELDYNNWDEEVREYSESVYKRELLAIGAGGVLYPPHCSNEEWFNTKLIELYAGNQDDIWLKYQEIRDGIRVAHAKNDFSDITIDGTQENALYLANLVGNKNNETIDALDRLWLSIYPIQYGRWKADLCNEKDDLNNKLKYYLELIKTKVSKNESIYVWGTGKYSHFVFRLFKDGKCEKKIKGFVVSQHDGSKQEFYGIKVICYHMLKNEKALFIPGVNKKIRKELKNIVENNINHTWIEIDIEDVVNIYKTIDKSERTEWLT